MREEHLDLLPELHRDVVLAGLGDVTGNLAGVFMLFACDLTGIGSGAALGFGGAGLTDVLQGAITRCTFAGWATVRV